MVKLGQIIAIVAIATTVAPVLLAWTASRSGSPTSVEWNIWRGWGSFKYESHPLPPEWPNLFR